MTDSGERQDDRRPGLGGAPLGRRAFLGAVGVGAGLVLAGGRSGLPRWLGGESPYRDLPYGECLANFDASLSPAQRALTVRPWDHPARQTTNTVTIFKGPHIGTLFDADQVSLIERLYQSMLSTQGQEWLRNTITLEGKLEGSVFAIYSDAAPGELATDSSGRTQAMITGAHLMLRHGGAAASGYALGGPVAYGQQLGNDRFKVEGNAYAVHSDAANAFYASLDGPARAASRVAAPPHELLVQAQGAAGSFEGVRVGSLSPAARERAEALLEIVLSGYPEGSRREARSFLDENGGLGALHVSFYEETGFYSESQRDGQRYADLSAAERDRRELPYWQVWRIEGPGCVMHFKGSPHVHAYLNIVRDPAQQNVGEVLTRTSAPISAAGARELLVDALRVESGAPLAHYPDDAPARFAAGDVTTGLAYALDPYTNRVAVATIRGAAMSASLRASVAAQGVLVEDDVVYRVASAEYFVGRADLFGEPEEVEHGRRPIRDALVDYLRGRDLSRFQRG